MNNIYQAAYEMSKNNQSVSDQREVFAFSGFTTMTSDGRYRFSPSILQSFFSIKGLQYAISSHNLPSVFSEQLLKDLARFDYGNLDKESLKRQLSNSFRSNPFAYRESIKYLKKLQVVTDESIREAIREKMSNASKDDIVEIYMRHFFQP
jgi:hypothetical protein